MKLKIFIVFFVFVSCSNNANYRDSKIEVVSLDIKKLNSINLTLNDLAETVSVVKLNSKNGGMIDKLQQIQICDSFIFILDNSGLYKFFLNGEFISKIGRKGRGPGEYLQISSFTLDVTKRNIYLLDGRIIHKFSYYGEYISCSSPIFGINNILFANKRLYCTQAIINPQYIPDKNLYEITILTDDFNFIDKILPVQRSDKIHPGFAYKSNLFSFNDTVYYNDPLKDTIYFIEDTTVVPKYTFNKGSYSDLEINAIIITETYLILHLSEFNNYNIILYDKQKNISSLLKKNNNFIGFPDPINYYPSFSPRFQDEKWLIDIMYPYQLVSQDSLFKNNSGNEDLYIRLVKVKI